MARQNLSGMTPEERKDHKRRQGNKRKQKQREGEKKEREMAKKKALFSPGSPEVVEFVEGVMELPLPAKVALIAAWQREYKQKLPVEPFDGPKPGESSEDYWIRKNRSRDLELAKMLAFDYFGRQKAAKRKKVFNDKEADEAARLGITVFELQKRKKIAAWKAEKEALQHAREIDRLARKIAA